MRCFISREYDKDTQEIGIQRWYYTWEDVYMGNHGYVSVRDVWKNPNCVCHFCLYRYTDEPDIYYLSSLWVREKSRKQGLGNKLVKCAKDEVFNTYSGNEIRLIVIKGSFMEKMYGNFGFRYMCDNEDEPNMVWMNLKKK